MLNLLSSLNKETLLPTPKEPFIKQINEIFKIPMHYNENKKELNTHIIDDLELLKNVTNDKKSLYDIYTDTITHQSHVLKQQYVKYYTSDACYLTDTQQLFRTIIEHEDLNDDTENNYNSKIMNIWDEIRLDKSFHSTYNYITWDYLKDLNKSEVFLNCSGLYNIISPLVSLLIPIIILIIPFVLIKMKGLAITISQYIEILLGLIKNHSIGKLFTEFEYVSRNEKIYILVSVGFYLFSIYQNAMSCKKFYSNMNKIYGYFDDLKLYIRKSINNYEKYISFSSRLEKYEKFNHETSNYFNKIKIIQTKLHEITYNSLNTPQTYIQLGKALKLFYALHDVEEYNKCLIYSVGFNTFMDDIYGIAKKIKNNDIHFAQFGNSKKSSFKDNYYGFLENNEKNVKNNIELDKNIILTGPNASGKTTILKSVLINIILSQQFGCGFYVQAIINPYDYIHCYLNIPDTSGRDSLFQAEARRCKEMIDCIDENKEKRHFCMFDELYSGTNPEEAVKSGISFMKYMIKNKNVTCMMTTHFTKVCKSLNKIKSIKNFQMETIDSDRYTYKVKKGISSVKGCVHVLNGLNYPKEITDNM